MATPKPSLSKPQPAEPTVTVEWSRPPQPGQAEALRRVLFSRVQARRPGAA